MDIPNIFLIIGSKVNIGEYLHNLYSKINPMIIDNIKPMAHDRRIPIAPRPDKITIGNILTRFRVVSLAMRYDDLLPAMNVPFIMEEIVVATDIMTKIIIYPILIDVFNSGAHMSILNIHIEDNMVAATILIIMHELIILLAFFGSLGKKYNNAVGKPIVHINEIKKVPDNITDTLPISRGV